jgi:hypothetical protein
LLASKEGAKLEGTQMQVGKVVLACALLVGTSIAYAGEKANWSGSNEDQVILSELTSNVPSQNGHVIKQIAETWTHHSKTDPMFEGATAVGVEHQDINNGNIIVRGYGTSTVKGGDQLSYSWEGSGTISAEQEVTGKGRFTWTGGTGKFQKIKGGGTYTCKAGPKMPFKCDWSSEGEVGS